MKLTLDLTPEEEARLAASAKAEGLSVDAFILGVLKAVASPSKEIDRTKLPLLPIRHGRVIGELRREDIYEDV